MSGATGTLVVGWLNRVRDPCYHLACDTVANNNNHALEVNSDAIAYATLQYAMNTSDVNGQPGKGNFKLPAEQQPAA